MTFQILKNINNSLKISVNYIKLMKLTCIFKLLEIFDKVCYTNCIKLLICGIHIRCSMIKKIDVLGVQLDNYTVREAVRQVETYLTNDVLNTVETISMKMLMESEHDAVLKEVIDSLNLAVIGEKEILQAAGVGTMQRIRETQENDFYFEFFKRIERNKKNIFLLAETRENLELVKAQLGEEFPKLLFAGEYVMEDCVGNLDAAINEMNAVTPDVIVSVLPTPKQEHFFWEHRDKLNASIWYGAGELGMGRAHHGFWRSLFGAVHRGRLKNRIMRYEKKKYTGEFESTAENKE